jgi:hypothetical protein
MTTYLAKAIFRLSRMKNPDGIKLCDQVCIKLSGMTSAQLKTTTDSLNFYFVGKRMSWNNASIADENTRADVVDLRRAAVLLTKTLPTPAGTKVGDAEGWDGDKLLKFVQGYANATAVAGNGYFFKGSYWAFSSQTDRDYTKTAWTEAANLITEALSALQSSTTAARDLYTKWFGTGSRDVVRQVLERTRNGMTASRVGLAYNGASVSNTTNYNEEAPTNSASLVTANPDEWGYASPVGSSHNNVGLGAKFFNALQTMTNLTTMHATTSKEMEVTRGGALLHELTHRYAKTEDEACSDAVYTRAGKTAPAAGKTRAKGYGPYTCHILGQVEPALAVNNADTYRLFCEDARLLT